ncbi:MAG TPA: bifunctional riboflavin kinase/FAD synthetase [Actinocrinis sp.]|jgi:riboflavin kinase/FMN adenylyltransferase|uniref:bifunctional riboflavin kinase/FAD synthetase n=1 Tax=Actinocrinis sp. TaxID=1920516 RepID=UPI002DDCD184|nr:bifunctional riboflavin kinase/FAD synthetase [Actinocrinis sp.]HEV3169997.1 bifunctional riboflavin kinase/FAD synthetase [Actinocrinis sp.]
MERWHGLAEVPTGWGAPGGCVVTIGFFDGVHQGHRRVVRRAVELARERGAAAVAVTFDPHPTEVIRPGTHPPLLSTPDHRADLLESVGVDAVLVLPFTLELSKLSPEEFVKQVLVDRLHTVGVVVGENFRFGHRASGSVADLIELGARYGFTTEGLPLAAPEDGAQPRFSSTDVRRMVLDGDVEAAARCLGRPHRVEGTVVHGAQRGREMGFPTANVETPPHTAIPADGVYAGWLVVGGRPLPAAISVGTNPTFDGTQRTVEAYAIGRTDLELYGEHVAVDFLARIRGQEKFDSMESLVKRMNQDVEEAQALLENTAG